ncbi:peptidoglycan endopeptidase [Mycobacterium heckeshornense]|nr:peptidoglycan endopeptidase [Mycobacterium heckeshornense]PIJ37092.1 peptidoglycan endopeptidase [Mycobacterium heckeshornense]
MYPQSKADDAETVVAVARTVIGKPYQWGAAGPDSFDCSGLIFWAFAQIGVQVPRTSQEQAVGGDPVERADLRPGDVVTFYPDASHAALYSGNGNIIQAATYGVPVEEVPIAQGGPFHNARRYL